MDVTSYGGTVKRYEIYPDPERLKQFGITLSQLQTALQNANANVGADVVIQGDIAMPVRSVGLFGGGEDPVNQVLGMADPDPKALFQRLDADKNGRISLTEFPSLFDDPTLDVPPKLMGDAKAQEELFHKYDKDKPGSLNLDEFQALWKDVQQQAAEAEKPGQPNAEELKELHRRRLATAAAAKLRDEENKRILEIRHIVVTSINNRDILLEDLVEGGRLDEGQRPGEKGVVVGSQTRLGRIQMSRPQTTSTPTGIRRVVDPKTGQLVWRDEPDDVECLVLLHKGDDSLPALHDVEEKVKELNDPKNGKMLPGVFIEPYYDRTDLINVTTDTVRENLFFGMTLVSVILLLFLSNVRSAIIVAINIPLALLFAFTMLYARGKSANLLSIGAVDFGIIVDSSVVMVENIYRHISTGEYINLSLKERVLRACVEVEKPLLFSTLIMVCAFIPLFTMQGPEGQIFGPMADTYAFALGGALVLAVVLAPVLCLLCYRDLRPAGDNFLVHWLKSSYLRQLDRCLRYRWVALGVFAVLIAATGVFVVPRLGNEFMPELEEGNFWVRGTYPFNISLEASTKASAQARKIMASFPEVETVVNEIGRPDDGTDSGGYFNSEFFVPLRPESQWPAVLDETGWRRWVYGPKRRRTKTEMADAISQEMTRQIPAADWNFSQNIRDICDGGDVRHQGQQLRQNLRPEPGGAGPVGRAGARPVAESAGHDRRRRLQHQGRDQPRLPRRSGEVQEVGRQRRRRQQRHPDGAGRQGPLDDDRGRKVLRHHRAVAARPARQRDDDPRRAGGRDEQPGGAEPRTRSRPRTRRAAGWRHRRLTAARPTPATRSPTRRGCGCATSSRRWARTAGPTPTAVSSGPVLPRSTGSRASGWSPSSSASATATWAAPWPRPRRRPRASSTPPTGSSGAASSWRCRRPRGGCCSSSRPRWC